MIFLVNLFVIGLIFRITSVSPVAEIDANEGKPCRYLSHYCNEC